MAKKINKYSGMKDMFIQHEIDEETAKFDAARRQIEAAIQELENSSNEYDSGQSAVEDRNEVLFLTNKLRDLEEEHKQTIAAIKSKQKQ